MVQKQWQSCIDSCVKCAQQAEQFIDTAFNTNTFSGTGNTSTGTGNSGTTTTGSGNTPTGAGNTFSGTGNTFTGTGNSGTTTTTGSGFDTKTLTFSIHTVKDCATFCWETAKFMSSGSQFTGKVCSVCADICETCDTEFKKFDLNGDYKQLVDTFYQCATECRRTASTLPVAA